MLKQLLVSTLLWQYQFCSLKSTDFCFISESTYMFPTVLSTVLPLHLSSSFYTFPQPSFPCTSLPCHFCSKIWLIILRRVSIPWDVRDKELSTSYFFIFRQVFVLLKYIIGGYSVFSAVTPHLTLWRVKCRCAHGSPCWWSELPPYLYFK